MFAQQAFEACRLRSDDALTGQKSINETVYARALIAPCIMALGANPSLARLVLEESGMVREPDRSEQPLLEAFGHTSG
jgi:hypothetical protein